MRTLWELFSGPDETENRERIGHKEPGPKHILFWILAFGIIAFFLISAKHLG